MYLSHLQHELKWKILKSQTFPFILSHEQQKNKVFVDKYKSRSEIQSLLLTQI